MRPENLIRGCLRLMAQVAPFAFHDRSDRMSFFPLQGHIDNPHRIDLRGIGAVFQPRQVVVVVGEVIVPPNLTQQGVVGKEVEL